MMKSLYGELGQNQMDGLIRQIKDFQRTFKGNPQQIVQQMVTSGQLPQNVFNELAQQADQIMALMK